MMCVAPALVPHLLIIYISALPYIGAAGAQSIGHLDGTLATSPRRAIVRKAAMRVVIAAGGRVDASPKDPEAADHLPPSKLQVSLPTLIPGHNQSFELRASPPASSEEKLNVSASNIQQNGLVLKLSAGLSQLLTPVGFSHSEFYEHTNIKSFFVLISVITLLLLFDAVFLQKRHSSSNFRSCLMVTLLWQFASVAFACYIFLEHGRAAGAEWLLGYVLEYSFSLDNLSVFGFIFLTYETPDKMIHMILFRGLLFGLLTRTVLFASIGYVYAEMEAIIYIFGGVLVYSGLSSLYADAFSEDDASSPGMQKAKIYLSRVLRIWPHYDSDGRFFVRVKEDGSDKLCENTKDEGRWHCTLLVPVIVTIEICDLMFAVDSTTAVMFQVKDFFLCCSCTMLAMAGCRTLFFLLHLLTRTFHLVKYGISITLAYIGLELCFHHLYDVPAWITIVIVVGVLLLSVIASVLCGKDKGCKQNAGTGSAVSEVSINDVRL